MTTVANTTKMHLDGYARVLPGEPRVSAFVARKLRPWNRSAPKGHQYLLPVQISWPWLLTHSSAGRKGVMSGLVDNAIYGKGFPAFEQKLI